MPSTKQLARSKYMCVCVSAGGSRYPLHATMSCHVWLCVVSFCLAAVALSEIHNEEHTWVVRQNYSLNQCIRDRRGLPRRLLC